MPQQHIHRRDMTEIGVHPQHKPLVATAAGKRGVGKIEDPVRQCRRRGKCAGRFKAALRIRRVAALCVP